MNKAFEKICSVLGERLLFHQKLLSRKYRMADMGGAKLDIEDWGSIKAYTDAIDTVVAIEQEYNNGWIPCSEKLPEDCGDVLCTTNVKGITNIVISILWYNAKTGLWYYAEDDEQVMELEILAWQPLQEPYKEVD